MALCQSFFYAFNKVVIVLGLWGAEDVGGSITIHMFGAYFGLAVSYVLGPPKEESVENSTPNATSDLTTMIGTTLLWVYWPSFVGATETGVPLNENVCVMHTVLALLGSTLATFYLSQTLCHGKFDPVHVANSTLAGGVAVGSSARLAMTPGGALILGTAAGLVSVYGYVYSSPYLEKYGVYDTCGVGNLHGCVCNFFLPCFSADMFTRVCLCIGPSARSSAKSFFGFIGRFSMLMMCQQLYLTVPLAPIFIAHCSWPSVLGGLASIVYVAMDSDAEFLVYGGFGQCVRQLFAVASCLLVASGSGYLSGMIMKKSVDPSDYPDEYDDGLWWEGEYFDAKSE